MDFIERMSGIAPDGGSGSLEFLLVAVPLAGIAYLVLRARQRRQRCTPQSAAVKARVFAVLPVRRRPFSISSP